MHENQPYPPSLSQFGNLQLGKKSDLVTCVQVKIKYPDTPSTYDLKIFDGAAVDLPYQSQRVQRLGSMLTTSLFHLLQTPLTSQSCGRCLGYVQERKFKRINKREERRRRSEKKGNK